MSIEELKQSIIELSKAINDEVFLNRIYISMLLATSQKEESD